MPPASLRGAPPETTNNTNRNNSSYCATEKKKDREEERPEEDRQKRTKWKARAKSNRGVHLFIHSASSDPHTQNAVQPTALSFFAHEALKRVRDGKKGLLWANVKSHSTLSCCSGRERQDSCAILHILHGFPWVVPFPFKSYCAPMDDTTPRSSDVYESFMSKNFSTPAFYCLWTWINKTLILC